MNGNENEIIEKHFHQPEKRNDDVVVVVIGCTWSECFQFIYSVRHSKMAAATKTALSCPNYLLF